ncbi:amidase [Agrobacterium vitis]|uniref:amidase family protein n=1 Tax=Agrobacterium vitis TaxID=373 RepID=UPI0012E75591|nr:amidase family protein [Agrobacterium vitis]MVA74111.1 amidase [Agrobacterium vitis]
MNASNDPTKWTASEASLALAAKQIGAVELLDAYLARQAALDGEINAVCALNPDLARTVAQQVDADRMAGKSLPILAGLPMTIKDCFDVVGLPTTAGIPDMASYRPQTDADAVANLRRAGAVFYGKTNTPLAAADHQTYNPLFGLTRNPHDLSKTVGGSSGGAAAALAAGFTALELGSDIGGSIRIPSHYCGVYGHKSSWDTVSMRGHMPPPPGHLAKNPLLVAGPMARSAQDLSVAFEILSSDCNRILKPARHSALADFRIGVWVDDNPVDPVYASAILDFAESLRKQGAKVVEMPGGPSGADRLFDTYIKMLFATIGSELDDDEIARYTQAGNDPATGEFGPLLAGAVVESHRKFVEQAQMQARFQSVWSRQFEMLDVLLCPVSMGTAFPHDCEDGHGPVPQMKRTIQIGNTSQPYLDNLRWPGIATLLHLPATVRPLPHPVNGMPAGVQIIGPYLEDRTTLTFAKLCDEAFGRSEMPLLPRKS